MNLIMEEESLVSGTSVDVSWSYFTMYWSSTIIESRALKLLEGSQEIWWDAPVGTCPKSCCFLAADAEYVMKANDTHIQMDRKIQISIDIF